uniref:Uncharacterized protein n=1 Tax=Panagrolaimus davidi TaxID=227884 RepID=A0A914Q0Q3_9BILA
MSKYGHAGHGFSVTPVMREDFGDHKKIDLFFRNEDIQEIGYFRFKMTFQPNQKIENKWNILNGPNANEYLLPDWVRLPPGETYKESGLVVNGPLPVTLGLEHRYC